MDSYNALRPEYKAMLHRHLKIGRSGQNMWMQVQAFLSRKAAPAKKGAPAKPDAENLAKPAGKN